MLSQVNPVPPMDRLHAIRDRFAAGGSVSEFILVLTTILVMMVILYAVMRHGVRRRQGVLNHQRKLFDQLIRSQDLGVGHRDMLRRIARDLRLEHPTVLLLSPQLLRIHANQWMSATQVVSDSQRLQIDELSTHLFGSH